ncbi:hypothetical protein Poly24_24750 [Rosistilla carotiformis]|uniref:Carboxypeptidase regulatory-like domain-containing protein n=1 Tax=Rosistilla carotiformis TaxID=2528017 RepID=A0A518JT92_9BACT|nr:carboxypeptidase-like regulatory domain-containing protein [Rosistilla carotiformis]QDV68762.1 hypothetical protein Poly24_24750 [Rosistilla carotiformis]
MSHPKFVTSGLFQCFEFLVLACGLSAFIGCSGSDPLLADVRGQVTDKGQPLAGVTLMFIPESGNGAPSEAVTNSDGEYVLSYANGEVGARMGKQAVLLTVTQPTGNESMPTTPAGYSKQIDVVAGENVFNFDLSEF